MLQLCLLVLTFWAQQPSQPQQPLPEAAPFIAEFRKTLERDEKLLAQYTYTEKETEMSLDSKGRTKKSETNVYQVIHGDEEWKTYRRRISKNGVPLSEKDLEKQDRKKQERFAKEARKRAGQSEAKQQQEKAKSDREDRETTDDIFAMYDIRLVRREMLDGVSTILATFKSKPNYKAKTSDGKIMQHIAGRAWIAEEDHQLAKLEAEIVDPISIGAGLLAKLQKGSTLAFERRKINNEIWLPVKVEAVVNGRLLLLKGLNIHQVTEYSEHKKYSVDTVLTFGDKPLAPATPPSKPKPQ